MIPSFTLNTANIHVIATSSTVMDTLAGKFAFTFKEVSAVDAYPRYFLGKSIRAGKSIQVVLMESASDARRFIFNAQYTVDRVGYNQGLFFDPSIDEADIHNAIHTKTAHLVQGPRNMDLFHTDRHLIEQRHKSKLIKKGFVIVQ